MTQTPHPHRNRWLALTLLSATLLIAMLLSLTLYNRGTPNAIIWSDNFDDGMFLDRWQVDWAHAGNPTGDTCAPGEQAGGL